MNKRKVQAQMELDISFIGNTTKLVKQLQDIPKNLNLGTGLGKSFESGIEKSIKDTIANLNKLGEGLSKKGLSTKQYETFFNKMNLKIQDSSRILTTMKTDLQKAFSSSVNQDMLKDLEKYKKQLEEVNKLIGLQKAAQTRAGTSANKMKEETGLSYDVAGGMLKAIRNRRANKQDLTKNQQDWVKANGLDDQKLNRALELLKQIEKQMAKIDQYNQQGKDITGQTSLTKGQATLSGNIDKASGAVLTEDMMRDTLAYLTSVEPQVQAATGALNLLEAGFEQSEAAGVESAKKMAEGMGTLNEVLAQFGIALSAGTIVRAFKEIALAAFEFYKSLDSALNEIYIVSNLSIDAVNNLKSSFISMAKDTGMALDDITRSAVLFYQQGLSTSEVMEMTEVTSEFAKVAGIDATDAADKLTAAVNGYCLAAEDAALVADKFNKVAAASAADINELSTAFSKAAAQANQAGVGMDNYLAYLATMIEATREAPENIGTSLKTIMSRMQQVKEGGSTEDGETDVNQVETALKSVGIALRDTKGELRDLEEVFNELGPKWNQLDRNTQAYLGTVIAGTRQQSRFITLMQNWDRVLELSEESANSAGQQALMHAKSMDSIASKLQQFQVAWQEFVSNLADSDFFKGIIDGLTGLLNMFNSGSKPVIVLGAGIALLSKQITKLNSPIAKMFNNFTKGLGRIRGFSKENLKLAKGYATDVVQLKKLNSTMHQNNARIAQLTKRNKSLTESNEKIAQSYTTTDDEIKKVNQTYNDNANEIAANELEIKNLQNSNNEMANSANILNQSLEQNHNAYANVSSACMTAATSLAGLSAVLPGMAGSLMGAGSGAMYMVSGLLQIGPALITNILPAFSAFKGGVVAGLTEISAAITATGIGAIIQAIVLIITGATMAIKGLIDAFGNQDEKLKESVESVSDALGTLADKTTALKAANGLLKTYDELTNKIHRTAEEQEKLNDTVQQLADSFDLQVVEDEYGNLSINQEDLTDAITKLEKEAKDARDELIKAEDEAAEKFDGTRKRREKFYGEYLSTNRADIKSVMSDIKYDINTDELATDVQTINKLTSTLQGQIIDYTESISGSFKDGLTATEYIDEMMESINTAVDDDSWNQLFGEIDNLQDKANELTYQDISSQLDAFFENWAAKAGLTTAEMEALRASVEGTIYASSGLATTISSYQAILDKNSGASYDKELADLKAQRDKAWKDMDNNGAWDLYNPFYQSAEEEKYEQLDRQISMLEADKKDNVDQLTQEEKERYETMIETLGQLTNATAGAMETTGLFNDILDENGEKLVGAETILQALDLEAINSAFKEGNDQGLNMLFEDLAQVIENTDEGPIKEALQEKLDKVVGQMKISASMSWGDLATNLDEASEHLQNMNDIIAEFKEEGAMTLDTFTSLCEILDSINLEDVFDAGMMDQYLAALDNLNLGFDASSGMITAEGDALQSLQAIQEAATKAEIQSTINKLEAKKASLQAELAMIDAEMATNTQLVQFLGKQTDAEINLDDLKAQANQMYTNNTSEAATKISGYYANLTKDSAAWSEATIENMSKIGDAFNALVTGQLNSASAQNYIKGLVTSSEWSAYEGADIKGLDTDKDNDVNIQDTINALNDYNAKLQNTRDNVVSQIKTIDSQIGLLTKLRDSDLSKLGRDGQDSGEELDQYIGKLKEIYNILNRIQLLEHRLSTLDTYSEVAVGDQYADYLKQRLDLNYELMDQYDFLVREQKAFTNGAKDAIENSAVADVFDFDEFGQIIIDFEKYNALQDTAADGQKSLKEQADEWYETYTDMFDELQDDFDNYIAYLKQTIDLQQEMVDSYIEIQDQAAAAVQEIYQKILDTRLEAIDQEKEALEELRDARDKARKDQDNAKEISNLQTNIQRTMMDSSGASDISFIKAQQDMNDKLEDIADDKYSEMLDNIIERLEQEQDALQKNFDELFENQEWLFDWLDSEVMRDQERLQELFTQTSEWLTSSDIKREQLMQDWDTKYKTYMAGLTGNKTIFDIWDNINLLRTKTIEMDEALKNNDSKIGADVVAAIHSLKGSLGGGQSSGGGGTNSGGKYTGNNNNDDDTKKEHENNNKIEPKVTSSYAIGDTLSTKESSWLSLVTQYDLKDGKMVKDLGVIGARAQNKVVTDIQYYNGQFYYLLKGLDGYIKGAQLDRVKKSGGAHLEIYGTGGLNTYTGPAWLDGTPQKPEAVLNALQTEHFIKFTNALDNMFSNGNVANTSSTISIDTISFNVESMSSLEDGEAAFNMFVNKFKEIGSQSGIKIDSFKNRL